MKPNGINFSEDEQRVLEYFRPFAAGKWRRAAIFDISFIIISLLFGALYLVYRDPAAAFVAYAFVFWRACMAFWHRLRYAKMYRSIFNKYESRIRELAATSAKTTEGLTN